MLNLRPTTLTAHFLLSCLAACLVLATPHRAQAQQDIYTSELSGRTVTFTQLMEAMRTARPGRILFQNINVRFDVVKDEKGMDAWWADTLRRHRFPATYSFENCTFDPQYWWVLRNAVIEGEFYFVNCTGLKIWFEDCTLKSAVRIEGSNLDFLRFERCRFLNGVVLRRNAAYTDYVSFRDCDFTVTDLTHFNETFDNTKNGLLTIDARSAALDFTLDRCRFFLTARDSTRRLPVSSLSVNLSQSSFTNLRLTHCQLEVPLLLGRSTVSNMFLLAQLQLPKGIVLTGLSLNPLNTQVEWASLKNHRISELLGDTTIANAYQVSAYPRQTLYPALVAAYTNLYQTYRALGDRFSADSSYIEFKNIETNQYLADYERQGRREQYVLYILNRLMYVFSDYGTNTYRALLFSFWVILGFAGIYFITPFRYGDQLHRSLRTQYLLYAHFLTSPRSPYRLYLEHLALFDDHARADDVRRRLRRHGQLLPAAYRPLLHLTRVPLYNLFLHLEGWLYKRLLPAGSRSWSKLAPRQQSRLFWLLAVAVLLSICYFTLRKAVDSIILSLNVFSTLGFGELRVGGVVGYLTVIEGFLGWFLLSIFSVVLLNQLLQ